MKKDEIKPTTPELIGQADQAQIDAWKAAYKLGIYALVGGGHIGYFKCGNRHDVNQSMAKADTNAALDMYQVYAEATHIGGSTEILTNDKLFKGVAQAIRKDMEGEKFELVNL